MNENFYSEKDELYLLGGCLNDSAILYECVEKLPSNSFYFQEHEELFKVLKFMLNSKIEINQEMVLKIISDMKNVKIPLRVVANAYVTWDKAIDLNYVIERILRLYNQRSMYYLSKGTLEDLNRLEDVFELKKRYLQKLSELDGYSSRCFVANAQISKNYRNGKSYIENLDIHLENKRNGIDDFDGFRSGYHNLDQIIGGFRNGTSTIIGARSSSGKTTLIVNLIINIVMKYPEAKIGFFSLEMSKESIYEKCMLTMAGVNLSDVEEGRVCADKYQRICIQEKEVASWPLYTFDFGGLKISQMKSEIKKAIIRNGINICFIDYLTRIQSDNKNTNKHQEVDQVSKGIKECSMEFNIPFVTLSQLSRGVALRSDKRPVISDLRESGSIEEDSDLILLMHRPKHYDTSLRDDFTEIFVAKNRFRGDLGKITYKFENGILKEIPKVEEMIQGAMITSQNNHSQEDEEWKNRYVSRKY